MFNGASICHRLNSTSCAIGLLCLSLTLVLVSLWTRSPERVSLRSLVRQIKKAMFHFWEFWIMFIFQTFGQKRLKVYTFPQTQIIWLQMFSSLFQLNACILFITFGLLIFYCLFILLESILCCFGIYDWSVRFVPFPGIIGFIYPYHVHYLSYYEVWH